MEQTTETVPGSKPEATPLLLSRARRIVKVAAGVFGVAPGDIQGTPRHREAVKARRACAVILVTRMGWSHARTGRFLNRDHSSILHALKRFREIDDLRFLDMTMEVVVRSQAERSMPQIVPAVVHEPEPPPPPSRESQEPPHTVRVEPDIPLSATMDRLSWIGQVYVEAYIPPEVDAAFLDALRKEHGIQQDVVEGDAREAERGQAA